jgi:hypothetical protein
MSGHCHGCGTYHEEDDDRLFKKNPLADDCLIALAAGELSEGQAAALTGINRLSIRQAMQSAIKNAQDAWGEYRKHNPASPE